MIIPMNPMANTKKSTNMKLGRQLRKVVTELPHMVRKVCDHIIRIQGKTTFSKSLLAIQCST